ncbi:MAG: transglycosylase SLT domain-containing protein [Marmoricola sp.]
MPLPRRTRPERTPTDRLTALVGAVTAAALLPVLTAAPATAKPWPGHPDRSVVRYVVRPGDTATGLAVRYHAWTAELISLNRLGPKGTLRQGQELRIPIVVSAVRRAGGHLKPARRPVQKVRTRPVLHSVTPPGRGWLHAGLSRDEVRRLVVATARRYGVPPRLALAVAWQESGWQQRRVSSAGALGVMQVMPDTGRWMRWYAGRKLRLRDTHDNVLAGILTLRVLRGWTVRDNNAIAAYYQGLGAVRRHGYYADTRMYVAAVRAHERRITATGSPI